MIVLIIEILFFIVIVIAGVMATKLANYKNSYSIICLILMIILWVINAYCVAISVNQPTAIDVYKGKTELQIIYKGTIPVDSVVVFKNK